MFSERDLIEACKREESFAQQMLYEKYVRLMYGVCSRYISANDELNDVVQDGFIKVFDSIKKFRYEGSFEGWMKRVFVNSTINYLKSNRKHKKRLELDEKQLEIMFREEDQNEIQMSSSIDYRDVKEGKTENYEMVTAAEFSHEELLENLNALPEPFKIVFNLACIDGLKHEEIAGMLKIDVATSRTRLLRARNMLQKQLYQKSVERLCKS